MRKVLLAVSALGLVLVACGGDDAQTQPKTPTPPVATTATPPTTPPVAEAPKEEPKKETLGQLMEKSGRAMNDAMNAHDAKKLAALYTDSAVVKMGGSPDTTGRDAIEKNYQQMFTAFPDFKSNVSRVWVKNDVAIVEWAFNGTHQGDLWGMKGTEKKVGTMGVDVIWYTPEGLIKEQHTYFDGATIASQIGVSKQKARAIPAIPTKPEMFISKGEGDEAKNAETLKTITSALENKKEADFLAAINDNVEYDDMTQPAQMKGKNDAKKFFKEMTTGFPDAKHNVANTWSVGEYVISEDNMTGTHKGSFFGIPATKKTVSTKGLGIFQMKDGKMVKGWNYSNGADFMQQIGLMPKPGATPAAGATPATGAKPTDPKAGATPATGAKPADPKAGEKKPEAKPADKK